MADDNNRRDPASVNPKLASLNFAKELNNPRNPAMQVLTGEFVLARACMEPIHKLFLVYDDKGEPLNDGLQPIIDIFNNFGEFSPSIDGYGRQQQEAIATNSSRPVYQAMQPMQDDANKPGITSRILSFFSSTKAQGANK